MSITPEQLKAIIKESIEDVSQGRKETKLTLSIAEAAEISGIGTEKITELIYRNELPHFKVGSRTRINRDMFIEWLNKISEQKLVI
jgi:excisionase family DNA binding protein